MKLLYASHIIICECSVRQIMRRMNPSSLEQVCEELRRQCNYYILSSSSHTNGDLLCMMKMMMNMSLTSLQFLRPSERKYLGLGNRLPHNSYNVNVWALANHPLTQVFRSSHSVTTMCPAFKAFWSSGQSSSSLFRIFHYTL